MRLTRRELMKTTATGALAVATQFGGAAEALPADDFRAVVAVNLAGGHDGWNMAVPIDGRYAAYAKGRGRALALPPSRLLGLGDCATALHPSLAPLMPAWNAGNLGVALNTGPLLQPIDKALYRQRPDLRPRNVMLHDDAGGYWRTAMGRLGPLQTVESDDPVFAGRHFQTDRHFQNTSSDIARQLWRVARLIEMRDQARPAFVVSQYGYDTHAEQVAADDPSRGRQADLYAELAVALAAFQEAMAGLGLARNVTAFTVSEFGRAFRGNGQLGTDHAWGNNHLVLGGAAKGAVHGVYPDLTLGGPDDVVGDGRWLPSLSVEDYLAPIARWHRLDAAV
ncbi:MAG: hypothetical protein JWM91_4003 [Rhodospirillales bacterium]|nr:hypothetical protein [Rhodospirillales bacterium]